MNKLLLFCTLPAALLIWIALSPGRADATFSTRGVGASALEGDSAAIEASLVDARRSPAGGGSASAEALGVEDALLLALGEAIARQDREALPGLIEAWFQRGPAAVDALFARLEAGELEELEVEALGVLLQSAAVLARQDAGPLAPWTLASVAETTLGLVGRDVGAARVAYLALGELGAELEPGLIHALIDYHDGGGRSIGDLGHQLAVLSLMDAWARSMPAGLEGELAAVMGDAQRAQDARTRAVQLLLARDWRSFAPGLIEMLGRSDAGEGPFDAELADVMRFHMGARLAILDASERPAYLARIAQDGAALGKAIELLEPYEAGELLALADPEELGRRAMLELRVHAMAPGAPEAGIELLSFYEGDDYHQSFLLGRLLAGDGIYHPEVYAELEARFQRRDAAGDPLWGALTVNAAGLSDRQLVDAATPFLQLSVGEQHPTRERLVAALQERVPALTGRF